MTLMSQPFDIKAVIIREKNKKKVECENDDFYSNNNK